MGNKVTNSNTSNKCFRCKNTTAQQSCNQCGHKFCNICFKSNSRSIPNVCLRCALCGDQSNPPTYSELMKIPNKDLLWLLSFSGYAVQHLVEKEAIVKEIIVEFNKFYNLPPINISTTILEDEIHQPSQQPSCSNDIPFGVSPPTYKDHMTKTSQINNAKQNEIAESKEPDNVCLWKPPANKLVKLEDLPNEEAIQLLSNKQLIGLLKENHLSKDCLERDEIINKIKFLFRSENENKIRQSLRNELSECISKQDKEFLDKFECKICMDAEIDCVLLECGHAVMCIKCAVNVNQCPICNQSIIRRVKMFRS